MGPAGKTRKALLFGLKVANIERVGGAQHVCVLLPTPAGLPTLLLTPTPAGGGPEGEDSRAGEGLLRSAFWLLEPNSLGTLSPLSSDSPALCRVLSAQGEDALNLGDGDPSGHGWDLEGSRVGLAPSPGGVLFTTESPAPIKGS